MEGRRAPVRGWMVTAALVALCSAAIPAGAQSVDIALPAAVTTLQDFIAFRDATAQTPEGGAAVLVLAMLLYERDAKLGHDAMVIALDAGELRQDADGYQGFTLGNRAEDFVTRYLVPRPYLARSYLVGTSPETRYQAPATPTVRLGRNASSEISAERIKVFVSCTGADTPRPVTLQRNNRGVWKAYEYSTLFVGVRPPAEVVDDPL